MAREGRLSPGSPSSGGIEKAPISSLIDTDNTYRKLGFDWGIHGIESCKLFRILVGARGGGAVMKEKVEHKINLIEDADASGELAKVYDEWRAYSGRMPGI